jgi:ATP-dependent DNA helicase RecQ
MTYGLNDVVIHRQRIDESAPEEQKRVEAEARRPAGLLRVGRAAGAWCCSTTSARSTPCGNCDVCLDPPEALGRHGRRAEGAVAALRTGQRFGAGHLIDILRGKKTDKAGSSATTSCRPSASAPISTTRLALRVAPAARRRPAARRTVTS